MGETSMNNRYVAGAATLLAGVSSAAMVMVPAVASAQSEADGYYQQGPAPAAYQSPPVSQYQSLPPPQYQSPPPPQVANTRHRPLRSTNLPLLPSTRRRLHLRVNMRRKRLQPALRTITTGSTNRRCATIGRATPSGRRSRGRLHLRARAAAVSAAPISPPAPSSAASPAHFWALVWLVGPFVERGPCSADRSAWPRARRSVPAPRTTIVSGDTPGAPAGRTITGQGRATGGRQPMHRPIEATRPIPATIAARSTPTPAMGPRPAPTTAIDAEQSGPNSTGPRGHDPYRARRHHSRWRDIGRERASDGAFNLVLVLRILA